MPRHPPLRIYVIAWVPLVAVYTAIYMGTGSTLAHAIRSALLTVLPFALLGFLVLRVPRRVPWHEGRRAGFFAAQLGLTALYAVSAAAGVIVSWTLESFFTTGRAEFPAPPMIAAWQAVIGGLIYLAIAEDEPQARRTLRAYLEGVDWIQLAGEAGDGAAAVRLVDELEPDILFLDVRLPELTGLQVVQRIRHRPALVFTTAHDRFAVAAFELGALDYLLKPFGAERFRRGGSSRRWAWASTWHASTRSAFARSTTPTS